MGCCHCSPFPLPLRAVNGAGSRGRAMTSPCPCCQPSSCCCGWCWLKAPGTGPAPKNCPATTGGTSPRAPDPARPTESSSSSSSSSLASPAFQVSATSPSPPTGSKPGAATKGEAASAWSARGFPDSNRGRLAGSAGEEVLLGLGEREPRVLFPGAMVLGTKLQR